MFHPARALYIGLAENVYFNVCVPYIRKAGMIRPDESCGRLSFSAG
jgi:hypothetical protein